MRNDNVQISSGAFILREMKPEVKQSLMENCQNNDLQRDHREECDHVSSVIDTDIIYSVSASPISNDSSSRKGLAGNYATIVILCFVNLLNYMDRFTIAGVLKDIQDYFQINDSMSGLLQTVFICSYMIFAPIFGYLGDRYSRRMIMSVGIFIWSGAVLASSFVERHHFLLFLLSRGIVGIGEASYSTIAPTIIADLFTSDSRSRMLMVFYFAIPVGSGLGFVVGGNVAKAFGNQWQWGVRITPILGIVCLLLILLVLKEPKRGEAEISLKNERELKSTTWITDLKQLLKNKSYLWSTFGFTGVAFVAGALSWWAPIFVSRSQKLSQPDVDDAQIGLVFGIITCLAGFVGVLIGATWSQIWRRTNPRADPLICGTGMLLCTPFLFAALCTAEKNISAAWPLMFFGITCLSLNWSIISDILLYIIIPSRRATASAFQILLSHLLGDATSPYLIGLVSDALRGDSSSPAVEFYSLKHALFMPTFICVLSGFFFLGTAWYVTGDRRKADLIMKGEIEESGGTVIAKTAASAKLFNGGHLLSGSASNTLPQSDSSVGLLTAAAEVHTEDYQTTSSEENSHNDDNINDDILNHTNPSLTKVKAANIRRRAPSGRAPFASVESNEHCSSPVSEPPLSPDGQFKIV